MRKLLLATAVSAAFSLPVTVSAQTAPAATPEPPALTGNFGLFSEYRFRGISQTFMKPAIQGGFDYAHSSGIYLGNWNSNVNSGAGYPGGNLEMDFYGGWKKTWGDWGLDLGGIYYYYPGTDSSRALGLITNNRSGQTMTGAVNNKELYIGGSWKFLSVKYFNSMGDYFSVPGTKNSNYLDVSATYDLGGGWGVTGHVGSLKVKNFNKGDYTDWKLGVTKDLSGWVVGASYITTDAKGSCSAGEPYCFGNDSAAASSTKNAGKSTVVLSVSKTF
jgi:uncharacterized protein (TIGR02001 family)